MSLANSMFETVIEQLRSPLLQIHLLSQSENGQEDIHTLAANLIELLDNMQIASYADRRQLELQFEPINLLALAEDTAHKMYKSARMHNIQLLVSTTKRHPALANRDFLTRAYENMASSIIDIAKHHDGATVTMRADEINGCARFGVYSSKLDFSAEDLRRLKRLFGKTARPMSRVSTSPSANLYIADRLLSSMGARLRTSIADRQRGLATVLTNSSQLSLVG